MPPQEDRGDDLDIVDAQNTVAIVIPQINCHNTFS